MSTQSGKRLRIRRGNGTRTLANGELEFDYVNSKLRVGDGTSVGGIGLSGQSGYTLTRTSSGYVFPSETNLLSIYAGETAGYDVGGNTTNGEKIERYSFVSDGNATEVGQLKSGPTYHVAHAVGAASPSHGFVAGGEQGYPRSLSTAIMQFPFAASGVDAVDTGGDLTTTMRFCAGITDINDSKGYWAGNYNATVNTVGRKQLEHYPTVTGSGNATDAADLAEFRSTATGASSTTEGFVFGGLDLSYSDSIEKFPFASDSSSVQPATLTAHRSEINRNGSQSPTHVYLAGGRQVPSTAVDTIEKFTFAADTPAVDVGELYAAVKSQTMTTSTTSGYLAGGVSSDTIQKFPFASDQNGTDVGEITKGIYHTTSVGGIQF